MERGVAKTDNPWGSRRSLPIKTRLRLLVSEDTEAPVHRLETLSAV